MCSLHLTHPSAHTPGAVGSRRCGARGAVGGSVPCSRVSPQSWTIPAGAEVRTHNLGLQVRCSIIGIGIDRYRLPMCKRTNFSKSFVPTAIRALNT